jgi:hypothetical protein
MNHEKTNIRYLVHEYMHTGWEPLYFCDVSRDIEQVKLSYAGSCTLAFAFPELYNVEQLKTLFGGDYSYEFKQMLLDFVLNTSFRRDIFIRGGSKITLSASISELLNYNFVLCVPQNTIPRDSLNIPLGKIKTEPWFDKFLSFMQDGSKTFNEIIKHLKIQNYRLVLRTISLLVSENKIMVSQQPPSKEIFDRAKKLNTILRKIDETFIASNILFLATPIGRSGVQTPILNRQIFWEIINGCPPSADSLSPVISNFVKQRNISIKKKDNNSTENNQENLVYAACKEILENFMPVWKRLGML